MLAKLNHYLFLEGNIGINQMKRTTEEWVPSNTKKIANKQIP